VNSPSGVYPRYLDGYPVKNFRSVAKSLIYVHILVYNRQNPVFVPRLEFKFKGFTFRPPGNRLEHKNN
jgi:hypothetical protein